MAVPLPPRITPLSTYPASLALCLAACWLFCATAQGQGRETRDLGVQGGLPTTTQLVPAACQDSALAVVPNDGYSELTLRPRFGEGDDREVWHLLPGHYSKGYMLRLLSGYTGSSLHTQPRGNGVMVGLARERNDLWRVEPRAAGRVRLLSVQDGRALAVRRCGRIEMQATPLSDGDLDIEFALPGIPGLSALPLAEGRNLELVSRPSGKVLDVFGQRRDDGAPLVLWDAWGGANQAFRIVRKGPARVALQLPFSKKVLDANPTGGPGTAIYQWSDWGGPNQQWLVYFRRIREPDGSVFVVNAQTGFCLGIGGDARSNGAPLISQACDFAERQLFGLTPQRPLPAGQAETRVVD